MKEALFKINELAKFFGINPSAIRYYESAGLLTPAYVNPSTKYRYYDHNNVNTIAYILTLRSEGMGIDHVKRFMEENILLSEYVKELVSMRDKLNESIRLNEAKLAVQNEYKVDCVSIPKFTYYGKKYCADSLEQVYSYLFDFLDNAVRNARCTQKPLTYIEFNSIVPKFENIHFEVGIKTFPGKDILKHEKIEGVRTFHKGSYESIGLAYSAVMDYVTANGLIPKGNALEWYHESFNLRKKSEDFLTEIVIPVESLNQF